MFDYPREGEGYVLLGRMEGGVPGYLSYSVREAEQFYVRWRAGIPGKGWGAVRLEIGELIKVLLNFDLVSVNPRPDPDATEYLYTAEDFVRGLRHSG